MNKIKRELRRVFHQLNHQAQRGGFRALSRTRRANKPRALRERPELEIDSPLEFIATSVAARVPDFFFIQIGAYDGVFQDPVPAMAQRYGWSGVLVEPQPGAFAKLKENFTDAERLIFENAAISDQDGEMTFYTTRDQSSHLASFDRGNLLRRGVDPANVLETRVPTLTVESLLAKHNHPHAHLIQIDAEGYDAQIIRSINFDQMKPEIIRYEHVNLFEKERSSLIEHLASHGYRFLLEDADTIAYYDSSQGS